MILIVSSNKDPASLNIKKQLLNLQPFRQTSEKFQETHALEASVGGRQVKLITLNQESIFAQDLPAFFADLELVLFISRHSSESGKPTLSVHVPGNLAEAELGGEPRKVSLAPANAMRDALKTLSKLKEKNGLKYEVSYECTHHGPSLDVPAMFVELGSSPAQWADEAAAEAVARAALDAVVGFGKSTVEAVLGIGGMHYNPKFTRLALEEDIAFGHIVPKYAISGLDEDMLLQCAEKTLERVDRALLDWKGITGEDKQPLLAMLDEIGLPYKKA